MSNWGSRNATGAPEDLKPAQGFPGEYYFEHQIDSEAVPWG